MPIAYRAQGTPTPDTTAVTAIAPPVPATAAPTDLSVLSVGMKPFGTTITTPTGWTKIGEGTNGSVASGADTGSMKTAVFVRESAAVGAIPTIAFSGSPSSIIAVINTYSKGPNEIWDFSAFTVGGQAADTVNYTATGAAGLNVAPGDWVVAASSLNTDSGTVGSPTIGGMSGATLAAVNVRTNVEQTTGNDSAHAVVDRTVTAGSSNAAPTATHTNASASAGETLWLRLRVITMPILVMPPRN